MAKKFKATNLFEPLEIVLEGKTYTIERITAKQMEEIKELGRKTDKTDTLDTLLQQTAIMLGGVPEDYANCDIRELGQILNFIAQEISASVTPGPNGSAAKV